MKKMKFLSAILMSIFAVHAFSAESNILLPGRQILVDVANKPTIELTLNTFSEDDSGKPSVVVLKAWSGFECEIKNVELEKSELIHNRYKRSWSILVDWSPGADLSGCIVGVKFKGQKDSTAELFMNY